MSGPTRNRAFLLVLAVFAASRLSSLDALPVFIDESLHMTWPARLLEPGRLQRHLRDGKTLQIFLLYPVVRAAADVPWASRALSAAIGAAGLWAAWRLGARLYGPSVGLVAALICLVCPFALFYDRMALADIYVSSFSALSLLASLRLIERPGAGRALALGLALSACILSKMTGLVFLVVPLLAFLLLARERRPLLAPLAAAYAVVAVTCGYPAAVFFRHMHFWKYLVGMLARATPAAEDVADAPRRAPHLAVILDNAGRAFDWLRDYWTAPLFLLVLCGAALVLWRLDRKGIFLLCCALTPIVAFGSISRVWFPRYIVCSTVPFAVLAARFGVECLGALRERALRVLPPGGPLRSLAAGLAAAVTLLMALPALRFDLALLTDPTRAPLPWIERSQYVESWSSGYGLQAAAGFLRQEARQEPAGIRVVLDTASERTNQLILRAYLMNQPRLELAELELADAPLARVRGPGGRSAFVAWTPPWQGSWNERPGLLLGAQPVFVGKRPGGQPAVEVFRLPSGG